MRTTLSVVLSPIFSPSSLTETGFNPDVIERQLAHGERNEVRGAYNRAEYLSERKRMMQHWADYLDSIAAGAKVIPLPSHPK